MMTPTRQATSTQTRDAVAAVTPPVVMATSGELKDAVYALRYQAYRRIDAIPENSSRRFSDPYDLEPNSMTYLLWDSQAAALGSIRASLYLPGLDYGLPSFESYRDEIAARIGLDKRIIESSRFVTAETSFDIMLDMQFRLYRMIWANALFHRVDWLIMSMQRKHLAIYRRIFDCEILSEPKAYCGLKDTIRGVLCGIPSGSFAKIVEGNPRLAIDLAEASWYAL